MAQECRRWITVVITVVMLSQCYYSMTTQLTKASICCKTVLSVNNISNLSIGKTLDSFKFFEKTKFKLQIQFDKNDNKNKD